MIFDGKRFAEELTRELSRRVKTLPRAPSLGVCMVGDNPVSKRYIGLKKKMAERAGVDVVVHHFPGDITPDELEKNIKETVAMYDGYIIQLPLPVQIDTSAMLDLIPIEKDADMLSSLSMRAYYADATDLLPPVIGVFAEIIKRHGVPVKGQRVVVVGYGKLVGKPAEHWFKKQGAYVTVIDQGDDLRSAAKDADIIALGAGSPGLLKLDMIKDGAVVLDAGTSEDSGALKGDADPLVAEKAALFTPVPGGIGPITVVMLLKNLLILSGYDR